MVEISKDKNQALIYLKKFSSTDTLVIEAVKVLEVRDSKKYIVRAYDYHEPGKNNFIIFPYFYNFVISRFNPSNFNL